MKNLVAYIFAASFLASTAYAEILGSPHDFTSRGFSQGQICLPCHTPHNPNPAVRSVPLWNHEVTSSTYTVYSSPSLDAGIPPGFLNQPGGVSKLCLSCHDGTVAVDAFRGNRGSQFITGVVHWGTDLSNDHPISFIYDTELATRDGGLNDPTVTPSGIPGLTGTIQQDMLFNYSLECSSCHDVHNRFNIERLLKKNNAGSALCLTCHNK
jgi:predicted CXXCH cytochrome family protein